MLKRLVCHLEIITPYQNRCHRFGLCEEIVSHIFVNGMFSWCIWSWILLWWVFSLCIPSVVPSLLLEWSFLVHGKLQCQFWNSLAQAILWSFSLARNQKVFEDTDLDSNYFCSLILHYLLA